MKPISLFFVVIVVSISCTTTDDDVPQVEPPIITINVNSTFPAVGRIWAFVTDSRGDVISSQKLSVGSNKFTGTVPDIVNVTFFEYSLDAQNHYRFTTYPNVTPSSVIVLDQANGLGWYSTTEYSLSAKISVTNFEETINTSKQVTITDGYGYGYTQTTPPEMTLKLHNSSVNVLVSGFKGDSSNPVHGWINDVKNGDIKSIDFNDFVPFDKTISLPLGNSLSAYIGGYKLDGTKKISFTMFSTLLELNPLAGNLNAKVGYLEGFDLYETYVSSWLETQLSGIVIYRRLGTLNPAITIPEYDMTISNAELGDFDFTYTGDSDFQLHTWSYNEGNNYVFWEIYSDDNSLPVFETIPENISAQFPALNFSKFQHETSQFYHCSDGYNYSDYFQDFQKGNYPFTNPDYYELNFRSH
jgi:hypothetical protein